VLTVRAQVYVLNPETSNWAAASSGAVNVTMLYDPNTNNTRVVAMENNNVRDPCGRAPWSSATDAVARADGATCHL